MEKIGTCNFFKNRHMLCNEFVFIKHLINALLIHIEFTNILSQFRPKKICWFIQEMLF